MKRAIWAVVVVGICSFSSQAARQNTGQRLDFKIAIPPGKQPSLVLPRQTGQYGPIDLSALNMEKDETSIHLKGSAEIRFGASPSTVIVLRADEALYDFNTAEIQTRGNVSINTAAGK
jgi:lipopolysaccharide assembly outer membrane protein LptD (OstA)